MERLSGLDASFLYLETPKTHMHVAMAAILDPSAMEGGYSFEKIVDRITERLPLLPPFRRRLLRVPFDLHHPVWVEDPDFDIIHHVRRIALPAPGGGEELGSIAGRITSTPLDRSRPLWEVWVIEGLQRGCFAILAKVHHSAVDGVTGAGLLAHLFDIEPQPGPRPQAPGFVAGPIPSEMALFQEALVARARQPLEFLRLANETARRVLGIAKRRRDPETTVGATPLTAPRTHFNAAVGARRSAAFARIPLGDLKRVKNAAGCTVNDVVLAVCAGALRRYLEGRDALPGAPLIAVCPISVHAAPGARGTNTVSAMFTSLATDVTDPIERLRIICKTTRGAKDEHHAIGAAMLQSWAELAAPTTFQIAARFYSRLELATRHRPIYNVVISNVPGPPFPIYMAGARVAALYPMGPVLEGAGLNITVMSYCGHMDFGFMVASELMPDVWDLARAVEPAMAELVLATAAGGPTS